MNQTSQNNDLVTKELQIETTLKDISVFSVITSVFVDEENIYYSDCYGTFCQTPLKQNKKEITIENSKTYNSHTNWITELRKRKGEDLILTSSEGKVIATDPETEKTVKEFFGYQGTVFGTLDYKNQIYFFGTAKEILCWDFETAKLIASIKTEDEGYCGTLDEESGKIFVGTESGSVLVLDPESNEITKSFQAHDSEIIEIVSKDGVVYIGTGTDGRIKGFDSHNYQKISDFMEDSVQGARTLKVKWNYLFSSGTTDKKLKIWDLETTQLLYTINCQSVSHSFAINKNYIYATVENKIVLINLENVVKTTKRHSSANNFLSFFKNPKFSDFEIFGVPVHKFLIKLRCRKEPKEIKAILENNFKREEACQFLKWVYGKNFYSPSLVSAVQKIANSFGIQDLKSRSLQSDLIRAYKDENSKDFSLLAKDTDDDEEDDEYEEIKVHKFILLAKCGLFRDFFENTQPKNNQVKDYSGKSIESVEHFIKYLYFNDLILSGDDDPQLISEELEDAVDYYQLSKNCNLPYCLKKIKNNSGLNSSTSLRD
ncbi:wd repeat-containing protein [Anaeramoeba flamelloides]|uniref:Wd repeat-containing protein n=1 Tax=Anaeramoeba flamelloides TaxID=1746091 RepID=A0AAV7ZTY1_9EUKA|nr:wd repeat-containing protein [Anaeramoeba flamelloides]